MKRSISFLLIVTIICALCSPLCLAEGVKQPEIISESAVLMDAATGQVLWEKNMHERKYPASITKIMTVLLAVENLQMADTITMTESAVHSVSRDSSHIALTTDEVITVEDAVCAALLMSANDACNGLAEKVSGSIEKFAALMTAKAAEVGALDTNFNNANGLKDENHYTTAYDMAMITRYAVQNETFRNYFGMKQYTMQPNNKQPEKRPFNNQHSMLTDPKFAYEGIVGGKAGYTTDALYTLVTVAERDGRTLVAVVMRSPKLNDKYTDTKALLDYGFSNFQKLEFSPNEVNKEEFPVVNQDGDETTARLTMNEPISFYALSSIKKDAILQTVNLPEGKISKDSSITVTFDLPEGTTGMYADLGTYTFHEVVLKSDEEAAAAAAAAAAGKASAKNFWSAVGSFFKVVGIIVLVIVGLFVLLVIALILRKQHYRRKKRRRAFERQLRQQREKRNSQ
ncbi:MAG: D-alanyl-D-alanine carboxypeptidase [Oscillospiraceae bacterium]|nr:D-alanyl-D-alanine carboxypeptidase [Oscillospiraceae bacterium]